VGQLLEEAVVERGEREEEREAERA